MSQRIETPTARAAPAVTKPAVRFLKTKLLVLSLLCGMPVYGALTYGLQTGTWVPAAIYAVLSIIAFTAYGYDKQQARRAGQRLPEKWLHAFELLGGWPGALLAQQVFRHKTRKFAYQLVFWLIVALHELFWFDRLVLGGNVLSRHFY